MEDILLLMLSFLYGMAAVAMIRKGKMKKQIIYVLVAPLVGLSFLYAFGVFFIIPHWAVAFGQASYLGAIIIISFKDT
jgi:hypothetical protein